jgi:Ser/Thr protein kinase RdoA (MazF antagonist)
VRSPEQAYAAAKSFGAFQSLLADLPGGRLHETIPDFHHTPARFARFQQALAQDAHGRAAAAVPEIAFALARAHEVSVVVDALRDGTLPERVTHNDTKLNNVLLDDITQEGVCVIDLDTVMPGSVLYDFGDLVRTSTSPAAEDEIDLTKVQMQLPMFAALVKGYLESAGGFLTPKEKELLPFAGKLITFEIGLRFLTDWLEGDTYFKIKRPTHNLDRARTQFKLVESIEAQLPAMQALVANLPLLAKREFQTLRKLCGVDDEDLADMVAEIRRLDPKPGRSFGGSAIQPVIPDVTVRRGSDGSWLVELNAEGLPRVLVNHSYATRVVSGAASAADKTFITGCLQNANWLTKSLEQRARTILKVASEIVRHQDAFFAKGVEHLRPLNLKTIADAIAMHESTVSRVTSNKYMSTPRGLFELKYFFTASIPSGAGGEAHSAEAVRFRIKQLIDAEAPEAVLSDDAIVLRLKEANVDIARRTVAKYRESLRIPSSVERRREKLAMQQR